MSLFTEIELNSILRSFCQSPFVYIPFTGVTFDSRLVKPGDLFLAFSGKNQDGHAFVQNALEKGAAGALVTQNNLKAIDQQKILQVSDVYQALKALSHFARQRSSATLAAVTGSVGKTTVKEGLGFVLGRQKPTVKSFNSYNNDLGVALSLVHLKTNDSFGVFEIGMNQAGETAPLAQTIAPHVALITAIGPVHIEYLKTIDAIALEKAEIFSGVCKTQNIPGGAAILPKDNPFYALLRKQAQYYGIEQIIDFGQDPASYIQLKDIQPLEVGQRITAVVQGRTLRYSIRLLGLHNAVNSLAILAACSVMGADIDQAAADLADFVPVLGRGKVHIIPYQGGELTVIDESYNANLLSMNAALKNLADFQTGKVRKIAILGDMKELGPYSCDHHKQIGMSLKSLKIDKVAVCGTAMATAYDQLLPEQQLAQASTAQDLCAILKEKIHAGDILMIKGSLSMKMNTIVTYFTENI